VVERFGIIEILLGYLLKIQVLEKKKEEDEYYIMLMELVTLSIRY